jgi:hypothetical protein
LRLRERRKKGWRSAEETQRREERGEKKRGETRKNKGKYEDNNDHETTVCTKTTTTK